MTASNQNPTTAAQIVPGETPGYRFHRFGAAERVLSHHGESVVSRETGVELRRATPGELARNRYHGDAYTGAFVDRDGAFWRVDFRGCDPEALELDAANLAEFDPDEAAQMRALAAELRAGGY